MRRSVLVAGATVVGSRRAASTAPCVSEIEWSSRAPRGGAWIETLLLITGLLDFLSRAPREGAWIETTIGSGSAVFAPS